MREKNRYTRGYLYSNHIHSDLNYMYRNDDRRKIYSMYLLKLSDRIRIYLVCCLSVDLCTGQANELIFCAIERDTMAKTLNVASYEFGMDL